MPVLKNNEEIADLFPIAVDASLPVIAVDSGIAPEAKESVLAQLLKIPLRGGSPIRTMNLVGRGDLGGIRQDVGLSR